MHSTFRLGDRWEDGISSTQKLQQAEILLPLQETLSQNEDDKTEPNYTESFATFESEENNCCCQKSTKNSSLNVENQLESNSCKCHVSSKKSIKNNINEDDDLGIKTVKERHISIDSARDSGIGENSNFADNLDDNNEEKDAFHHADSDAHCSKRYSDLRGYWQPKVKKSLADRLPEHSFHLIPPCRYIFPGAEVFYDPDEKLHYEGDSSSSSSSDIDSESESQSASIF